MQLHSINKFPSFPWFSPFIGENWVFENLDEIGGIDTLNGNSSKCPTSHKQLHNIKPIVLIFFLIEVAILLEKMSFYSSFFLLYYLTSVDVFFYLCLLLFLCRLFKCWCSLGPLSFLFSFDFTQFWGDELIHSHDINCH